MLSDAYQYNSPTSTWILQRKQHFYFGTKNWRYIIYRAGLRGRNALTSDCLGEVRISTKRWCHEANQQTVNKNTWGSITQLMVGLPNNMYKYTNLNIIYIVGQIYMFILPTWHNTYNWRWYPCTNHTPQHHLHPCFTCLDQELGCWKAIIFGCNKQRRWTIWSNFVLRHSWVDPWRVLIPVSYGIPPPYT